VNHSGSARVADDAMVLPTPRPVEFLITALVLIVVPGPSVVFVIGRGVALGPKAALATVAGNASGFSLQLAVVSIGLGSLVASSRTALTVLQVVGAAYIVYLGIRNVHNRRAIAAHIEDRDSAAAGSGRAFREGFAVGATNPKGVLMFTAVLPQFVDRSQGRTALHIALLGAICILMSLATDGTWAIASGSARRWLGSSPKSLERLTGAGGVMLVGVGILLALTGHAEAT
jgi:threonine/homoserine/homoserine lactone efflux protein